MSLSIEIVGLPNVGKSTLFNALTWAAVLASDTSAGVGKALAGLGARSPGSRLLLVEARIDPARYEVQF